MYKDLSDQRYGRLMVLKFNRKDKRGKTYWHCRCDCGNETIVRSDPLINGSIQSCGCLSLEMFVKRITKHGYCSRVKPNGNSTYVTWKSMKQRCYDANSDNYPYYGGRGIKVCERWLDSFNNFVEDMGERPEGMTIDRVNPNGNYDVFNCRWADSYVQNNNQRRHYAARCLS